MVKKLVMTAFLFAGLICHAQQITYRSFNYFGYLTGQKDGHQLMTTHGIQVRSYFFGLGVGADNYQYWSIPLFASFAKYLLPSSNTLYFNINAGTSFVLEKDTPGRFNSVKSAFRPKAFGEAGLGYRFPSSTLREGGGFLIGAYYSYKHLQKKLTIPGNCPNPPCADTYEYFDYKLNRWAFKVGLAF